MNISIEIKNSWIIPASPEARVYFLIDSDGKTITLSVYPRNNIEERDNGVFFVGDASHKDIDNFSACKKIVLDDFYK